MDPKSDFMAQVAGLSISEEEKNKLIQMFEATVEAVKRKTEHTSASQESGERPLCPEHPEDLFSNITIDTVLSKADNDELRMLQYIYKEIAYSPKMPYLTGNPRFAMRSLDFSEPNVENIIVGECQSGKSAEIAWTAWCSYFVLGCVPVIYVRNNGGRTQGIEDMTSAVMKLNERITDVLKNAENVEGFADIIDKVRRCVDSRRFLMEIVTDASKIQADGLAFRSAFVLVSLLNATHLKKMMEPFRKSRKQWFFASLVQKRGPAWEVKYHDCSDTEVLAISDIKTSNGKKISPGSGALSPGVMVRARKSAELAAQDGLLKAMKKYGEKEGKRRLLFIMDEADLSVGNPERNKNQGEKLMFQTRERGDLYGENRGAREYVFGSVFVTATPQALFICAWKSAGRPEKQRGAQGDAALEDGSASGDNSGGALPANVTESGEGSDSEDDRPGRTKETRLLKPNVVHADRPDNYVAYHIPGGPENGLKVERRVLEERFQKVKNMTQIYREVWIASKGSEEGWRAMEREVLATKEPRELWPGFELRFNHKTKATQVHVLDSRRRNREQDAIYDSAKDMYSRAKALQTGQSIWEQDGEAIQQMLLDMLVDSAGEPFRHALIISDKTKTIQKQRTLAQDILRAFRGAQDLAVAVYNCTDGITVGFSEGMHAQGNVLQRAVEATELARGEFLRDKERCGLGGGPKGSVSLEHNELVISSLPIGVMYEGLKGLCSRVVVISGEIGGRGVAYHDLKHERILTDMYTAHEVFADATITQHGELLTQVLGRLNTVETFSLRGLPVPAVRLWATQSVHDLHATVLGEVRELCAAVVRERDYCAALRSRPLWITGETARGEKIPLRMSRPAFSAKKEREMRGGGARKAPITDRRHRGIRLAEEIRLFPAGSRCKCVERLPLAEGDRDDDAEDGGFGQVGAAAGGGRAEYQWDPLGGTEWSAAEHSVYEVEVPPDLVDAAAAARFCAQHAALAEPGRANPWLLRTLRAARAFVAAGAAGPREAQLFLMTYHGILDDVEGGRDTDTDDSEWDAGSSSGGSVPRRPRRRRRLALGSDSDDTVPAAGGGGGGAAP